MMLCLLAYLAGAWAVWWESFPFDPHLRHAFIGLTSIWIQYVVPKHPFAIDRLWPSRAFRQTANRLTLNVVQT